MRPATTIDATTSQSPSAGLPRLTVALTFDHDAISDSIRRGDPPIKLSHGEFGPRVGAPRIAAGHELASHGWHHEDFSELPVDERRGILARSFTALERFIDAASELDGVVFDRLDRYIAQSAAAERAPSYSADSARPQKSVSPAPVRFRSPRSDNRAGRR